MEIEKFDFRPKICRKSEVMIEQRKSQIKNFNNAEDNVSVINDLKLSVDMPNLRRNVRDSSSSPLQNVKSSHSENVSERAQSPAKSYMNNSVLLNASRYD